MQTQNAQGANRESSGYSPSGLRRLSLAMLTTERIGEGFRSAVGQRARIAFVFVVLVIVNFILQDSAGRSAAKIRRAVSAKPGQRAAGKFAFQGGRVVGAIARIADKPIHARRCVKYFLEFPHHPPLG